MKQYLSELNTLAVGVLSSKWEYLDVFYLKIIEGKETGYEFKKLEPNLNLLKKEQVDIENRVLYEHCAYLIELKNNSGGSHPVFFDGIETDLKRSLELLYSKQRKYAYFGQSQIDREILYIFTDSVIDLLIDRASNKHLEWNHFNQKLSSKNFMYAWRTSYKWDESKYGSNPEYTELILGKKCGDVPLAECSPMIRRMLDILNVPLQIYREDKFSDLSLYTNHKFENIFSMHYEPKERKSVFYNKTPWASQCMISLEHENHYLESYKEMMYLTTRRARLKVLVTYYDNDDLKGTQIVLKALCANFSNIIRQSNNLFSENPYTEYLLILGSRLQDAQKIIWNMQAFNWSGEETEKYSELY